MENKSSATTNGQMNSSQELATRRQLSTKSTVEIAEVRKTKLRGGKMSYRQPNINQMSRNVTRSIKKRDRRCTCSRCLRLSNTKSCQFTQKITMINRRIGTERLTFASVESSLTDLSRAKGEANTPEVVEIVPVGEIAVVNDNDSPGIETVEVVEEINVTGDVDGAVSKSDIVNDEPSTIDKMDDMINDDPSTIDKMDKVETEPNVNETFENDCPEPNKDKEKQD